MKLKKIMTKIKLYDYAFQHATSMGNGDLDIKSNHFEWYRGTDIISDWCVVTEGCFQILDKIPEQKKVGLIVEPKAISPATYEWIKKEDNYSKFDFILTHSKELIELNKEKFKFYPLAGTWIEPKQWNIYDKSKNISLIASNKNDTIGHQMRHEVATKYHQKYDINLFGRGYKKIESKFEALKDYRFSIVIENERSDFWFTEKLIDCFLTGTIPIYWGCPSINKYFSTMGMVIVNKIDEFEGILNYLSEYGMQVYEGKFQFLKRNFEEAKKYYNTENWLWENYFCKMV